MRRFGLKCNFYAVFKCAHPHITILLCKNIACHLVVKAIFHALIVCHPALVIFIGTLIRMCMVNNSLDHYRRIAIWSYIMLRLYYIGEGVLNFNRIYAAFQTRIFYFFVGKNFARKQIKFLSLISYYMLEEVGHNIMSLVTWLIYIPQPHTDVDNTCHLEYSIFLDA